MRILYCASEANPFCGSGGLADVAGSLPHTLCRKGQDCRIVVPLYGTIPQELKNSMNFITNFTVPVHGVISIAVCSGQDGMTVHTILLITNIISREALSTVIMTTLKDSLSSPVQFLKCFLTLISIPTSFIVMTGRRLLFLFTTICSIHTDHGTITLRVCSLFTTSSIRVNTAGKLTQSASAFLHPKQRFLK